MKGHPFKLVPILVGQLSADAATTYGRVFAEYLEDQTVLIVISSDFCHWGDRFRYCPYVQTHGEIHQFIEWLDHQGMELIEQQNASGFAEYLRNYQNTICGRDPILILLHALKSSSIQMTVKFTKYDQSNRCKRQSDSSVSYAAALVYTKAS